MRVCPTCGARYEAPAQFCQRDGVPLRIEQEALADLIETGAYDRHLRRMRRLYRARRDLLADCIGRELPGMAIEGAAAGLHLTLRLPAWADERQVLAELRKRGVATEGLSHYAQTPLAPSMLFLGYGRASESTLKSAVRALAEVMALPRRGTSVV